MPLLAQVIPAVLEARAYSPPRPAVNAPREAAAILGTSSPVGLNAALLWVNATLRKSVPGVQGSVQLIRSRLWGPPARSANAKQTGPVVLRLVQLLLRAVSAQEKVRVME